MFWCFGELFSKSLQKWLNSWKSTKNHRFGQNFATFQTNYHVFAFRWTFQEKVAKSALFREKAREIIDFTKTCNFSRKLPCLDQLYGKKLQKMPHFVKKHEKPSIWQKLSTFRKNYPVLAFSWTFEQGVAKIASFRGKAREFIDLAKTMQLFLTNYHVLVLRWTFQQKFAESGSIREKARKIIDLAKTLQLFKQTTMSLHFDELFRKKLQKVPYFVRKHEK